MFRPFRPPWFDHPNNIQWRVQVMQLLTTAADFAYPFQNHCLSKYGDIVLKLATTTTNLSAPSDKPHPAILFHTILTFQLIQRRYIISESVQFSVCHFYWIWMLDEEAVIIMFVCFLIHSLTPRAVIAQSV
jgi:hypothetical protein